MARPRYPRPKPLASTRPQRVATQRKGLGAVGSAPLSNRPEGITQPASPLIAPNAGGILTGGPKVLPPDPAFDREKSAIETGRDTAIAGYRGERGRTLQDYGYTAQFDANDNLVQGSLAFDPTNVFSRAALLLKKYREAKSGNTNALASAGQLNSGAYGRQQRLINFNESQGQDALSKGIMDFLARNQGNIAGARTGAETAIGQAEGARLDRAPDNPLYDPTSPGNPTAPKPGGQYDALGRLITAAGNGRPSIVYDAKKGGNWHIYPDGRRVFVKKK